MDNKVNNAIILSAGFSHRFVPLSIDTPKALLEVNGEILIERQIKQLKDSNINDIYIVVGYKAEMYKYLINKYNVCLIYNDDYNTKNNISSIYAARDYLCNSYICSSDIYYVNNPFVECEGYSYYSVNYSKDDTDEWCVNCDNNGYIISVDIGGHNTFYMCGHSFWNEEFCKKYRRILDKEYNNSEYDNFFWEDVFIKHIDELLLKTKYYNNEILEFDSLDELRKFDVSYQDNTRCKIISDIAKENNCSQKDLYGFNPITDKNKIVGFNYCINNKIYKYLFK